MLLCSYTCCLYLFESGLGANAELEVEGGLAGFVACRHHCIYNTKRYLCCCIKTVVLPLRPVYGIPYGKMSHRLSDIETPSVSTLGSLFQGIYINRPWPSHPGRKLGMISVRVFGIRMYEHTKQKDVRTTITRTNI